MFELPDPAPPSAPTSLPERRPPGPVALVDWPADEERRHALALIGEPRLLLVAPADAPPLSWGDLEDWIRLPAPDHDVDARANALTRRSAPHPIAHGAAALPVLDADRVLHLGGRSVRVGVAGARVLVRLLHDAGAVVSRAELVAAGWPHRRTGHDLIDEDLVDREVAALRPLVAPLGVTLHTVGRLGHLVLVAP
ncbi:hypothetical protein BH10ACT1_BH10ACT1_35960 [soil metagenome]